MKSRRFHGGACVLLLVSAAVAPAVDIRLNDPSRFELTNAQTENPRSRHIPQPDMGASQGRRR
jgi:hypothetical protein